MISGDNKDSEILFFNSSGTRTVTLLMHITPAHIHRNVQM